MPLSRIQVQSEAPGRSQGRMLEQSRLLVHEIPSLCVDQDYLREPVHVIVSSAASLVMGSLHRFEVEADVCPAACRWAKAVTRLQGDVRLPPVTDDHAWELVEPVHFLPECQPVVYGVGPFPRTTFAPQFGQKLVNLCWARAIRRAVPRSDHVPPMAYPHSVQQMT